MKQIENRNFTDSIRIIVYPNLKEKLKILFSNRIIFSIDLNNDSDNGIIEKNEILRTK